MKLFGLIAAVATALAVATGCGGDEGAGGSEAAGHVPAETALFVSIDTDFEGDQWQTAERLLAEFPGGDRLVRLALAELEQEGDVDFERDVKPAVGPEVAFAVLEFPAGDDEPPFVGLTQPRDQEKFEALLARSDEEIVTEEVDGWTVFSDSQANIDSFKQASEGDSLADAESYAQAMDGLAEDPLVSVYVNGERAQGALEAGGGEEAAAVEACFPDGKIPSFGFTASGADDGARFDGNVRYAGDPEGFAVEPYDSELVNEAPGDALVFLSLNDLETQFAALRDCLSAAEPAFERALAQFEQQIGLSIEDDIAPLFAGETAFYIRPGTLLPELTLVLEPEDAASAMETVDALLAGLRSFDAPFGEPTDLEIAGVEARQVAIEAPFSLFYGVVDGRLVLTSTREGIADLVDDGEGFAEDEGFNAARERAGVPDETSGFLYVNLEESIRSALGFAEAGGSDVDPEVNRNLEPLDHLFVYQRQDGNTIRFTGLLAID